LTPSAQAVNSYYYPVLCGHYFCDAHYTVSRPSYDTPLLLFIRSGTMTLKQNGQSYHAQKGEIILLDCLTPHTYFAQGNVEFLYLHFGGCNAQALAAEISAESPILCRDKNLLIGEQLYTMFTRYTHNSILNPPEESLCIYQLLMWLAMPQQSQIRPNDPIHLTVQYIRANIGKPITLEELAKHAHLSVGHFSHEFKRMTGFAPLEYVINTRIEKAKMLLLQTTLSVTDIAYEVGYESGSSLSSLFIKKIGCSPREYRRSNGIPTRQQR
jgi:AraC-like DNA-binding protein